MTTCEADEKSSVGQSELSIKTSSPTTNKHFPFTDINLHKKSNSVYLERIYYTIWSIFLCLGLSSGLIGFVESSKMSYITPNKNSTIIVFPPAFLSYFSTFWLILVYPLNWIAQVSQSGKKKDVNLRKNLMLVFPVKYRWCQHCLRIIILIVLWNIMAYCIIRSAYYIDSIDIMIIFCTNSSTTYLIYWVMMHKKFIALRVMAFILSSSGMIINVYINTKTMLYKVMCSTATVAYASFYAYSKSHVVPKNSDQASMIYFVLASLNTAIMWPVFLFTSVVTSTESIMWNNIPWTYFIGCAASVLVLVISIEMSHQKSSRGIRNILFLATIPITYLIDTYWLKTMTSLSNLQIMSLVFVALSVFLTSFPSSWMTACSVKYLKKPTPVRSRRVSISARLNLMGNGGVRMSASQPAQSGSIHRDSVAADMMNRIGSFGSHIFSARTRNRVNSVFAN